MNGRKSKVRRMGAKYRRKAKKPVSKKRSKYSKKIRKGKAGKVKAKNVKGLSRAVHKILDGNFQHAKRIIIDAVQSEAAITNGWQLEYGGNNAAHSHMFTCGVPYEIMDHAAVLFNAKIQATDFSSTSANVASNFAISEKLHVLGIKNEYNFSNQTQLPICLEFYVAHAKADCSIHPVIEYTNAIAAQEYTWNGTVAAYNNAVPFANIESDFSMAPVVSKFWKIEKRQFCINPGQSVGTSVSSVIKDFIPVNHVGQQTVSTISDYAKGSQFIFYRYLRKLVAGSDNNPRRPTIVNSFGLVVDFRKTVRMRHPEDVSVNTGAAFPANSTLTSTASRGNRLVVWNLLPAVTGTALFVELNGTQVTAPV